MRIDLWSSLAGDDRQPYMETALLENCVPRPLIVVCPGGGYTHYGRYEGMQIAEKFNSLGFHAVVLRYRIQPTRFPEPVADLLRRIRKVKRKAAQVLHIDENANKEVEADIEIKDDDEI